MRFLGVSFFLALAAVSGAGRPADASGASPLQGRTPGRGSAESSPETARRLGEFLSWAHPSDDACAAPADVTIVETWEGVLRARYRIVCGALSRTLQGIFQVRAQPPGKTREGVWQVAGGFEAEASSVERALGPPGSGPGVGLGGAPRGFDAPSPPVAAPPPGLAPPPGNTGSASGSDTPLRYVAAPEVTREIAAEYPEEAGRARLIGEARVEILVQISPDGTPVRARPLRGPDPDLGMRRAATDAVMRWRFEPARLGRDAVTFYRPVELIFNGLPPESRDWIHRALFHVEAIVSGDEMVVAEALGRLRAGASFKKVASGTTAGSGAGRGGDWGFVSAASLPAAVRRALHESRVGEPVGPVTAEDLYYLMIKRGEIYYAILPRPEGEATYRVVHQKNAPQGQILRQAVESDIADYLAESRRQAYMNEAARLMGIRQVRTEIGQLAINTDVLDDGEIETLGLVIEATIHAHEEFWATLVPLRPFSQQVQVYAWARLADHDRLHRLWQTGRKEPAPQPDSDTRGAARPKLWSFIGEYIPASRILSVPCERMSGHLPVPILIHEAIHMLDYERSYAAGVQPSQWFEEGLATYFGFSQIGSRLDIEPGDIRRSGTIVSGSVRVQFDPRTPLLEYTKRVRDEGPVSLPALLASKTGEPMWSGDRAVLAYGASWTLVHFLLHGNRGAHRAAFGEYARAETQGRGGYDTFVRLFGPDLRPLEEAWHRYEINL